MLIILKLGRIIRDFLLRNLGLLRSQLLITGRRTNQTLLITKILPRCTLYSTYSCYTQLITSLYQVNNKSYKAQLTLIIRELSTTLKLYLPRKLTNIQLILLQVRKVLLSTSLNRSLIINLTRLYTIMLQVIVNYLLIFINATQTYLSLYYFNNKLLIKSSQLFFIYILLINYYSYNNSITLTIQKTVCLLIDRIVLNITLQYLLRKPLELLLIVFLLGNYY